MFLWIIIIGVLIYFLMNGDYDNILNKKDNTTALEKLNKRLANGDISVEEYNEIKQTLSSN
ncbi:MAG: SHOCT domain-containing protein [Candidatus Izimaplasma sp.]|nr:SHOCT domain-containing protein [Candidatus Izimaplasma bacterium]